eukprot:305480_1
MGYCLAALFRILGPRRFIEEFLASFTWRGSFNHVCHRRCEEYLTAYQTYSVHHKYYYDSTKGSFDDKQKILQSCLSVYDTDNHLNNTYLSDLSQIILSFSESELGEICYLFHIWKDNLLIPIEWSSEKIGPAWNIKKIFQDILKTFPMYKQSLKYNKNFRISMNIIEKSNHIYNTVSENMFWTFLQSKSDHLPGEIEEYGDSNSGLPIWQTAYPIIKINTFSTNPNGGKEFELTDGNTFSNKEWIDDTQEIKRKLDVMNDDSFQKNMKVKIQGLKSKPHWNGINGVIVEEYNFKRERWCVKIDKPVNQCALIKTCNLCKE